MNLTYIQKIGLTFSLAIILFLLRYLVSRWVSIRETIETRQRRQILIAVRDALSFLFFLVCLWIWYPQLKTIATTLAVIAVALVIATKEYILNITGFLFLFTSRIFSIGDRIDLGEMRGDVVDTTVMGVFILEIGPGTNQYTGRTVFIPNSMFLTKPVKNETRMRNYVFHVISFPLRPDENWEAAEKILLEIADEIVAPYVDEIRIYLKRLARRHSLETPAVEPRIYIQMPEADHINLVLRMPVPIQRRARVEQEVIRKYLTRKKAV